MTNVSVNLEIQRRGEVLYKEHANRSNQRIDHLFVWLMMIQWVVAIALAFYFSPYAWAGKTHVLHIHVYLAIFLGGSLSVFPVFLAFVRPGAFITRTVIGISQMLWSALFIHLTGGRIETHFHVFGSLAFLAFYRDWRVLMPATMVVVSDHLLRQIFWPESVYGVLNPEWWRFLEHAFWVVFEDIFLIFACVISTREMHAIAFQQAQVEATDRLKKEMEIATHLQESILPKVLNVKSLEIAAKMNPATEMGGDYYDVIDVPGGAWIGIGDVAGHGLEAGVVMMQAQSAVGALVLSDPYGSPKQLLQHVNKLLYTNVRKRLLRDEHMTFSLLRYYDDGRVVIAGAHEEFFICRKATGNIEFIPTKGTWLGVIEHILAATIESTVLLNEGDLLVLYTDGITEGQNSSGEQFGLERLTALVQELRHQSVEKICDEVLTSHQHFMATQQDDRTLMVIRRKDFIDTFKV